MLRVSGELNPLVAKVCLGMVEGACCAPIFCMRGLYERCSDVAASLRYADRAVRLRGRRRHCVFSTRELGGGLLVPLGNSISVSGVVRNCGSFLDGPEEGSFRRCGSVTLIYK